MYAKILNNAVVKYPYLWTDFEADNNNTNYGYPQPDILTIFPQTDIAKEGYTLVAVTQIAQPTIDPITQDIAEGTPVLENGVWTQVWNITQASADEIAQRNENQASYVRKQRNAKLTACDWTQAPDNPIASATKTAWATYRQALRDLPKETGFPWTMTWPTDPTGAK
jgi:Phage tail assembly chaperone protein